MKPWISALLALALVLVSVEVAAVERRPMPDYDGREEPPPDGVDVLVWIPRVIFYPVYLVTEYVIRKPLGALLTAIEKSGILGATGDVGFFPTAFIEFSFRPSIGLYFYADNFPTANDALRIHFAWGGNRWWHLTARQRIRPAVDDDQPRGPLAPAPWVNELSLHFELKQRPDLLFVGQGPDTIRLNASRYFRRRLGGHVDGLLPFGVQDSVSLAIGVEQNTFGSGSPGGDERSIEEAFDVNDPEVVPGFDGYLSGYLETLLQLDTRDAQPAPGSGARLELFATLGTDLTAIARRWLRYGTELAAIWDASGNGHTVSLRQFIGLVDDLGGDPVPFTELAELGGIELLRGFRSGRYRGDSAWVTTLQYNYPVWVVLTGFVFFEVGNVFGPRLEGFAFGEMVSSFGLGVRTQYDPDFAIDVLVGGGTTPFDAPEWGLAELRFQLGVSTGF